MLGQRMSSFFILIWKSNLSCTLLPTFPVPVPLHLTKTYISKKQILVKKNWGAGRRSHFGPWEVCLCDCSLLFSLLLLNHGESTFSRVLMQTAFAGGWWSAELQLPSPGWLVRPQVAGAFGECGCRSEPCCRDWVLLRTSTELCAWAFQNKWKVLEQQRTVWASLMATW